MFNIGDYIMYGKMGVCQILGIDQGVLFDGVKMDYYVLQPVYKNNSSIIKAPVGSPKIHMRKLVSRQEVYSYIDAMPDMDSVWIVDDKARFQQFNTILSTGNCGDWIDLIRAVYFKKRDRKTGDKSISPRDLEISKEAKRLLHEEFSIPLAITPEEVEQFILSKVGDMDN